MGYWYYINFNGWVCEWKLLLISIDNFFSLWSNLFIFSIVYVYVMVNSIYTALIKPHWRFFYSFLQSLYSIYFFHKHVCSSHHKSQSLRFLLIFPETKHVVNQPFEMNPTTFWPQNKHWFFTTPLCPWASR